ncbi:hypothetical protein [uncultured Dubosiella sp.]|nr:hypothetical protein [uncultured Dubosiella sp.]
MKKAPDTLRSPDAKKSRAVCGLAAFLLEENMKVIYGVDSAIIQVGRITTSAGWMEFGGLVAEIENLNAIH